MKNIPSSIKSSSGVILASLFILTEANSIAIPSSTKQQLQRFEFAEIFSVVPPIPGHEFGKWAKCIRSRKVVVL